MNRIYKFRAWDKQHNCFTQYPFVIDNKGNVYGEYVGGGKIEKHYIIMQFTGLLDKNGVEIYEGDILKVDGRKDYENCRPKLKKNEYLGYFFVEMEIGHWGLETGWNHIKGYDCSTHIMGNTENGENIEIIGNIYEHSELLKDNTTKQ